MGTNGAEDAAAGLVSPERAKVNASRRYRRSNRRLAAKESATLLADLQAWCTQPQFVLRHNWQQGDLVIWDNTGLLHRALPFEPTSPR